MKTAKLFILTLGVLAIPFLSQAQDKKVAVTSFWVSKHIDFEQLGGPVQLAAEVASLVENPNFNLQPVLDNFYKTFTEEYAKQFPFALLPEENVLNNPDYVKYEGRWNEEEDVDRDLLRQRFLTPKTYKPLTESLFKGEKSNQMQMVEMYKETADGVMFVSMSYSFVRKMVPMTAGITAYVRIKIWNKEGKKVFAINEAATSKKSIAIVGGIPIMKPEKLLPLCESASEKLVIDLGKKIKKITNKVDKKL